MQQFKTKKGLDVPISGAPEQVVHDVSAAPAVAILGADYIGMKPTMLVKEGDVVKKGQPLFEDKKTPGVLFTAPASGTVTEINRGAKRVLQSVVIKTEGDESVQFDHWSREDLDIISADQVQDVMVASGMWPAFRTRPYSKTPALGSKPDAIFVTAIDTSPLAADPNVVAKDNLPAFEDGLRVLSRLTTKPIYVCQSPNGQFSDAGVENVKLASFEGSHPAGLVGTHIHFLHPVSAQRTVWHINYQDVIALGHLFTTGELYTQRIISVAGPQVKAPKLIRTQLGAKISTLVTGNLKDGESRLISGSVLNGATAKDAFDYLGRYHNQISVIKEDFSRIPFHYVRPGLKQSSQLNVLFTALRKKMKFDMTTLTNGSMRAMVPVGYYERLIPLDILPTQLLRALITTDTDLAQNLGALELDEEDIALCTYVTSSKVDYGDALRRCLTKIEIEG